ncbi:MAG TPA: AAA family ATPase [Bacillota bacterium]|jgi:SpoVK/Ycf46/Vps4 family AAA+-type ATPase|nr:AAA family ATPase [Peptococcaceae bacterium MAG4]NLW37572.1 ATP-binding protein [Peptococcaceae bacterium]HPU35488.1 AAA family ATPase [Bacillota bacterium]HPZ42599.1 AAA family ATPase [Bacillota bacterium]HUM58519.1 AAA family ATPase [Bacillota bacterium]
MKGILAPLRRLDRLIEKAVDLAQAAYGPQAAADPYRGLYINRDEVRRLLEREPGAPLLWSGDECIEDSEPQTGMEGSRIKWLKEAFGLSHFDLDIIIIALAPELDTRYERLYAYLQDNVTRRKASVDLALNLLCSTAEEKLERRSHFAPDAPLVRNGLIHLIAEPNNIHPSLLSHYIILDEQIINLLLYQEGLDSRLAPFCELIYPAFGMDRAPLADDAKRALVALTAHARRKRQQLHLYFQGPRGAGKRMTAEALAFETGMSLMVADFSTIPYNEPGFRKLLRILFREAWFKDALLYLDETYTLLSDEKALSCRLLLKALAEDSGITVLTGTKPWAPRGFGPGEVVTVPFTISDFVLQRKCWENSLTAENISIDDSELDVIASRFRLTRYQIMSAVAFAKKIARWNAAAGTAGDKDSSNVKPSIKDILTAARAQSGHELKELASKVDTSYTWDDIVLPQDTMAQLREMCQRVAYRHRVLDEWGFGRKLSMGKGVNALFSGPSGTGKTMAAGIIANELGLDLYKIDLSGVVSKYIGETEKNLDRIFSAAENANAILFFDEADALFGRRSEVRDAHDRYANIEISYLLQKMEEYEGITILATNLRRNLDDAFVRRMAFTIHFAFPDEESRLRIWGGIWPEATPLAVDVDLKFLARQFKLSGGNIKNIALAASFLAAADEGVVTMEHLLRATQREYQKMGKALSVTELFGERKSPQSNGSGS